MTFYAIVTAPQRERAVEAMLFIKGYDVFLPIEIKNKRVGHRSRKFVAVVYPMFVRYIFVGGKFSWLDLMAERHVTGVVGFDGAPAAIGDAEMQRLKAMSGSAIPYQLSLNPHRALRAGEMAEIGIGPFAGQIVKITGLHGRKARVFLNLFGSRKEVEIPVENLEAA